MVDSNFQKAKRRRCGGGHDKSGGVMMLFTVYSKAGSKTARSQGSARTAGAAVSHVPEHLANTTSCLGIYRKDPDYISSL